MCQPPRKDATGRLVPAGERRGFPQGFRSLQRRKAAGGHKLLDGSLDAAHNDGRHLCGKDGNFSGAASDGPMERLLEAGAEQLVVSIALLIVFVAVAAYVIGKIRAKTLQHDPQAGRLLSKFRELHSKGQISDAEFRTIKTTLAAQLREELNDNGETG